MTDRDPFGCLVNHKLGGHDPMFIALRTRFVWKYIQRKGIDERFVHGLTLSADIECEDVRDPRSRSLERSGSRARVV